ncbi:YDG/SRA domain-containing protein [Streptomyces sp. NPDC050535]|uniref:YDG/SRA domain-containing protein n=1 Tax=Streptomyces sp. NPDC050535 TaxID=3365626 RepID=UPI0037B0A86C
MIGDVPNVEAGQEFSTRRQAGVHRSLQASICWTKQTGAESIVVSGGYKNDYGEVIVYTGHGGQNGSATR